MIVLDEYKQQIAEEIATLKEAGQSIRPEELKAELKALEELSDATLEKLESGQIVYDHLYSTSLVMIGGQALMITAYPLRNRLIQTLIWATLSLLAKA